MNKKRWEKFTRVLLVSQQWMEELPLVLLILLECSTPLNEYVILVIFI